MKRHLLYEIGGSGMGDPQIHLLLLTRWFRPVVNVVLAAEAPHRVHGRSHHHQGHLQALQEEERREWGLATDARPSK